MFVVQLSYKYLNQGIIAIKMVASTPWMAERDQ